MKHNTLVVGDLAINNGIVAKKPTNMSRDYWMNYEVPRIGKTYSKKANVLYGSEYDIDSSKHVAVKADVNALMQEEGECLSCKI